MPPGTVPDGVRRLILESIDSVSELEALLLLRQSEGTHWTVDALSARLYVDQTACARALAALARRGFLDEAENGFSYRPASPSLAEDVSALADAYSRSLVEVTQLIHSKPSSSVQDFARAFRIRKDR